MTSSGPHSSSNQHARVSARKAHLLYVDDTAPGWSREKTGRGFRYVTLRGRRIRDAAALTRIRRLAIPPAWHDVWICRSATGHLQATGRDERGRKQYLYHPRWRETRDENKF